MATGKRNHGRRPAHRTEGPEEFGTPIACGGQVVMIGDFIAVDEDGVVVIPATDAATLFAAAERHATSEATTTAALRGAGRDRGWVVETLRAKGTEGA